MPITVSTILLPAPPCVSVSPHGISGPRHSGAMSAASSVLSQRELLSRRLAAQNIAGSTGRVGDVAATVRQLFATQAQDFAQSLWGLGLRTPGAHRSDVLRAMTEGSIVRSSSLRGTLMMVAAEDLRGILSLTAERTIASTRTRRRQLELDEATMTRARQTIEVAGAGRNSLGREAVLRTLEDAGIRTDRQRGHHILWLPAERGILCWGPPSGSQHGMVLVDEWIDPTPEFERDELLARFAIRYFAGHGPATVADLAWWSRLTLADARRGITAASDALCDVMVDGTNHWRTDHFDRCAIATESPGTTGIRRVPARVLRPIRSGRAGVFRAHRAGSQRDLPPHYRGGRQSHRHLAPNSRERDHGSRARAVRRPHTASIPLIRGGGREVSRVQRALTAECLLSRTPLPYRDTTALRLGDRVTSRTAGTPVTSASVEPLSTDRDCPWRDPPNRGPRPR